MLTEPSSSCGSGLRAPLAGTVGQLEVHLFASSVVRGLFPRDFTADAPPAGPDMVQFDARTRGAADGSRTLSVKSRE